MRKKHAAGSSCRMKNTGNDSTLGIGSSLGESLIFPGKEELPLPFRVLLARLRIKWTRDRGTGKIQIESCKYGEATQTWKLRRQSDKMRLMCHPERGRRE